MQTAGRQIDIAMQRRLKIVYDHFDLGNNKKALQEINRLLKKKCNNFIIVKVLKALALIRLGNTKEGKQCVDEVIENCPTDTDVLKFLRLCLYELNLNDLICTTYENAFQKEPTNEELFAQLYMVYAIDGQYKKQNQIAMNLSKTFPQKSFRFWTVLSILLQAINHHDQTIAQNMLYPLAKRMIEKFVGDNQFKESSEVELYLVILDKMGDYNKAVEVLDGEFSKLLNNSIGFVDQQKADFLFKLKKYDQAFDIYANLVEKNTDATSYYLRLIEIIKLNDIPNEKNRFVIKLFDLFEQLKSECDFKVRGYYLARIELVKQMEELSDASYAKNEIANNLPTIDKLLVEYYQVFGIKQAFIFDFIYLNRKYEFKNELMDSVIIEIGQQVPKSNSIKNEEDMIRHSNFQALLQAAGHLKNKTKEDKIQNFKKLVNYYNESLKLKNNFTKTEFNHGDFYLQIAVYYLNELNAEQDDDLILTLIIVLNNALRKCTANYTLKVFLIYLYNLIGASSCSYLMFEELHIKYILYDSLSYLVFDELYLFCNYLTYSNLLNASIKFFQTNTKDTLDYLSMPYRHNNYPLVIEILTIERRLNQSIQSFQVQLEKIYLDFVSTTRNYDQLYNWISTINIETLERKLEQGKFVDNRNYSVYRTYDHKIAALMEKNQQHSYDQTLRWIKIRVSVLKVILLVERIVSKRNQDLDETQLMNSFNEAIELFKKHVQDKCENGVADVLNGNGTNEINSTDNLYLCKSISKSEKYLNYTNNYRPLFEQIEYINSIMKDIKPNDLNQLFDYWKDKVDNLMQFNFNENTFNQIGSYLCDLNCFTDLFSIILILITLTHKQLKQSTKNRIHATEFNQFIQKLENLINNLIAHLKSIDLNKNLNKKLSSEIESIVYSNDDQQSTTKLAKEIKHNIVKNYENSIKETAEILITKSKLLKLLS